MADAFDSWLAQNGGPMPEADPSKTVPGTPEASQETAASILASVPSTDPTADPETNPEVPQEAQQPTEPQPKVGIYEALSDSLAYDTVTGWAMSQAMSKEFEPDPDFKLNEETLQNLGKGIPIEYWGTFNDAQSPAEAQHIRSRLLYRMQAEKQLEDLGWKGIGVRLTAQAMDVPALAASFIAGEGAGGVAASIGKVGRIGRIVSQGLATGATDAALQAYIYSQDPMGDSRNILYSAALGSVFGSVGGLFAKENKSFQRVAKEIELDDVKSSGATLTPKGERYFADVTAPSKNSDLINTYLDNIHKIEGTAQNPHSSALGDFQFIDSTFLNYAKKSGSDLVKGKTNAEILALKTDTSEAAKTFRRSLAENFTHDNLEHLMDAGVDVNGGSLYLSHFLGSGDAVKVLKADPNAPIESLVNKASIASNPEVFKNIKTAGDAVQWASGIYASKAGGRQTALTNLRYDMTGILKRDATNAPEWADIGNYLAEDSAGNLDHTPLAPTISHEASMIRESTLGDFLRTANRAYDDAAKNRGYNWVYRVGDIGRSEVMEEAGLVARGITQAGSKEIDDIASKWREVSSNLLRQAKSAGVKGFEDIADNEAYVPRIWRSDKIAKMADQFGMDELKLTVSEALARGLGLDLNEAQTIINASWRKIRQRDLGSETQLSMLLDGRNKEALVKQLEDHGVAKDVIDSISNKLEIKPDGTSPRAKSRLKLDESYVSPRTGLKVTDLLENDLERLGINYIQHMSGNIAFAKFGFPNRNAFDSVVRKAVDASVERGHLTDSMIRRREKIANTIANNIMGIPNTEPSAMNTLGQMLLQYNYARLGGGFGFASIPETMEILASTGVRNFIQTMPSLRKVFRSLKDGKDIDLTFIRELESMGVAQDMVMARAFSRYDMWDGLVDPAPSTKIVNGTFKALNTSRKITGIASGLAPLTRFQQIWAGQAIVQNLARGNLKLNAKRLAQLGLSPLDAKIIQEQLQKYSTFQPGLLGRKVKSINLDHFDNEVMADKLRMAVVRYVNRSIQKQDIGELPELLVSSTLARVLAQFKTFGIVAWSKKTLAGLHTHDVQTALSVGLTSLMGSMVYAGQTYLNSLTKDNPEEYRSGRLGLKNLLMAGIQRSGSSSIIPMVGDGVSLMATGNPVFNQYARTSELPIDPVTGNPTYQLLMGTFGGKPTGLLNKALGTPYNLSRDDYHFSRQDLQTIRNLLPWSTMIGASQFYDAMGSSLPQRSEY